MKKTISSILSVFMLTGICLASNATAPKAPSSLEQQKIYAELSSALEEQKTEQEQIAQNQAGEPDLDKKIAEKYPEFIGTDVFPLLRKLFKANPNFEIKSISYKLHYAYGETLIDITINGKTYSNITSETNKTEKRIDLWKNPAKLKEYRTLYKAHQNEVKKIKAYLKTNLAEQYNTAKRARTTNEYLKNYQIPMNCSHKIEIVDLSAHSKNYLKCTATYTDNDGKQFKGKTEYKPFNATNKIVYIDTFHEFNSPDIAKFIKNLPTEVSTKEKLINGFHIQSKKYECEEEVLYKDSGNFKPFNKITRFFDVETNPYINCSQYQDVF